jgi:phosphoserine phosphatase
MTLSDLYSDYFSYLETRDKSPEKFLISDVDHTITSRKEKLDCSVVCATKGLALSKRLSPQKKAAAVLGFVYSLLRTVLVPDKNPSNSELKLIQSFGKGVYFEDILAHVSEIKLNREYVNFLKKASENGTGVILMTSSLAELVRALLKQNGLDFFVKGLEVKMDKNGKIISLDASDSYTRMAMESGINSAKKKYTSGLGDYFDCGKEKIIAVGNSTGDMIEGANNYLCPMKGKVAISKAGTEEAPAKSYVIPVRMPAPKKNRQLLLHEVEQSQSYASPEISKQI